MDWDIAFGMVLIGSLWATIPLNAIIGFFSNDTKWMRAIDMYHIAVFALWCYVTFKVTLVAMGG